MSGKKKFNYPGKGNKSLNKEGFPDKELLNKDGSEYEDLIKFKTISEKAGHGIGMRALSGEFIYINDAYARMLGYSKEEILGKGLSLVHTPEQIRYVKKLRGQKRGSYIAEIPHRRKDGSAFPALVTGSTIRSEDGDPLYHSATVIDITELKQTEEDLRKHEEELELKNLELEQMNAALKVMLKQREIDKLELEENLLMNVKELITPKLERIKALAANKKQLAYINILEENLSNVISPFNRRINSKYLGLTPTEIQVANLVKDGKTNKETAILMNLSSRTVEFHRSNIRRKFGIQHKKTNMRSFLLSLS